ncbi:PrgI family protein [Candidatus Saccharibacteria bacterium]|nr:MAG: PrgI family protein [Candidatus Saccharibacteria bacterium]
MQDVEAEDKLVGPLSLRQFIYAAISAFLLYLSFLPSQKMLDFYSFFLFHPHSSLVFGHSLARRPTH